MTTRKLLIASANAGKIKEISMMLAKFYDPVLSLRDRSDLIPPPEIFTTYHDNALQKALWALKKTGFHALADDSGIEIKAMNNEPGVYSARFMGENASDQDRNNHVLDFLHDKDSDQRRARFICLLILVFDNNTWLASRGVVNGTIASEPKGGNGFGYDPIFVPDGYSTTFASMDRELKNSISHRGRAIQNLVNCLTKLSTDSSQFKP